ncbi:hypothetical protein [Hufsiella ginkgonis]|uniref:Oligosaccharide repeat unit polymerase n=1 Tax=Hufsiella ginkgonis TaxID=2695274 RepID=A0A7K1Y293_9SPHI|nr:hypothetical protein [Hufsiella ginkgonis]MXV17390.1 hypothetical protein [Hufsiella ginkgonis]
MLLATLLVIDFKKTVIHKFVWWIMAFFVAFLLSSVILNPFRTFYINTELSVIKLPYVVSFSRFMELFCCLIFVHYVCISFRKISIERIMRAVYRLIRFQIYWIGTFFVFVFCLYRFGILHVAQGNGFLVYDTTFNYSDIPSFRLKGFFVEGGPLGLFYAYLFVLYDGVLAIMKKKDLLGKAIIILIIYVAQSKAGYACLGLYLVYHVYSIINRGRYRLMLKAVGIPVIAVITSVFLYFLLISYLSVLSDDIRKSDPNDVNGAMDMGRVPAMIIVPNMVKKNYLLGIGLGNYPLLRNDPDYLGFFKAIPTSLWDSPGLGGLIDLLNEGGIIFFATFALILYIIFMKIKTSKILVIVFLSFVLPFVSGVQLYFIYPWFSLALIIILLREKELTYE